MLTELYSQSRPVRLVLSGDGPTLIVNRDITNAVLYGDQSIASGNPNSYSVLDPLGSITVDGCSDVWAIPNIGTPTVDVVPGAGQWTPSPASVAAQINALGLARDTTIQATNTALGTPAQQSGLVAIDGTLGVPAQSSDVLGLTTNGIPLLRGTVQLGSATAQSLAAAATVTLLNNVAINKPSFEAVFKVNLPSAAGTIPFANLGVGWQDATTGLQVGYKQYVLTCGNGAANALMFYLSGPCRGNQLVLTLQNLDPAQIITYSWLFNTTSHSYMTDRFLQPAYPTVNPITFSTPGGNPSKGVLALTQVSIPASSTINRLIAACNATCEVLFDNSTANACNLMLEDPGQLYNGGTPNQNFARFNLGIQSTIVAEIQMPNGPLNMVIQNAGASGAVSPGVAILIKEY